MKKEIAKQWAAALRSKQYKKNRGSLRDGDMFCCLGVLCNLHAQAHPGIAKKQKDARRYMGEYLTLPFEVMEWADMWMPAGQRRDGKASLAEENDSNMPFSQIATIIDHEWETL